jgi:hypothetical protein
LCSISTEKFLSKMHHAKGAWILNIIKCDVKISLKFQINENDKFIGEII